MFEAFEKLMFWKKKDDSSSDSSFGALDLSSTPSGSYGDPSMSAMNSSMQGMPMQNQANVYGQTGQMSDQNLGLSGNSNGLPSTGTDPFNQTGAFGLNSFQQSPNGMQGMALSQSLPDRSSQPDMNKIHPRDIELILSRLDLIKSEIENVNHRLSHLEQAYKFQNSKDNKNWY